MLTAALNRSRAEMLPLGSKEVGGGPVHENEYHPSILLDAELKIELSCVDEG
jgi:hypothetical protein